MSNNVEFQKYLGDLNKLTDKDTPYSKLSDQYMPSTGQGDTKASQLVTAANKILYRWYNDGDAITSRDNNLTDYANWIEKYVREEPKINRIMAAAEKYTNPDSSDYILYVLIPLIKFVFREDFLAELATESRVGSIYECSGRFIYNDYDNDYEDDDEDM